MTIEAFWIAVGSLVAVIVMMGGAFVWTARLGGRFSELDGADKANATAISDAKHTLKNQVQRIDALEHARVADVERVVRLEAAVTGIDKAVERIERGQDRLKDELVTVFNSRFDQHAASLREVRDRLND